MGSHFGYLSARKYNLFEIPRELNASLLIQVKINASGMIPFARGWTVQMIACSERSDPKIISVSSRKGQILRFIKRVKLRISDLPIVFRVKSVFLLRLDKYVSR